jgi:hypothetical protein
MGDGGLHGWGECHDSSTVGTPSRMLLKFMEENSWKWGRKNKEQRCIEAAPRRMKMASRGVMFRRHERRDRCIVKRRRGRCGQARPPLTHFSETASYFATLPSLADGKYQFRHFGVHDMMSNTLLLRPLPHLSEQVRASNQSCKMFAKSLSGLATTQL